MPAGLAQAQEARAAWTRADLIHCIGQHLPDRALGRNQQHVWALAPLKPGLRTSRRVPWRRSQPRDPFVRGSL